MKNITAREIQVFVAGALGLIGFRALLRIPSVLFLPNGGIASITSALTGLVLIIAIAILIGKPQALLWARIYLWLSLAAGISLLFLSSFDFFQKVLPSKNMAFSSLTPAVLLALLAWSKSKRFKDELDG